MRDPVALERELHDALTGWAADHALRYPDMATLPYDPARYPAQRVDHAVTRTRFEAGGPSIPDVESELLRSFQSVLGIDPAGVRAALAPAVGSLKSRLAKGENIVVLAAHADLLHDIGVFCGGLAIALEDVELIQRNGALLNKVMSRETFAGVPIQELFRLFGNVYWVIPETSSAALWGVAQYARSYVNAAAMRALLDDMRRGVLLTIAPSGSAVRIDRSADGTESLEIPTVASSTASLVARFDAYLPAVLWSGKVVVGPVSPIGKTPNGRSSRKRHQEALMTSIMEELAAIAADAARMPVQYEGSSRRA